MRKLFLSFIAILTLSVGMWAQKIDGVKYIDANGVEQTADGVTEVTLSDEVVCWGTAGQTTWYVVNDEVTLSKGAVCNGAVHLILADDAKLTANGDYCQAGIVVSGEGNSLTIYGQASQIGQLIAKGGYHSAGIGGGQGCIGSDITISGGTVTATGDGQSAGIGGGAGGSGSDITVNGGMVVANGGSGASAIGGGFLFGSSNIFVDTKCVVRAGLSANPTDVIENTGADLASSLAGEQYTTIETYAAPIPTTYNDENGESHDINAIPIHPAAARVIWGETGKTTWLVVKDVDVILSLGAVCIGDIHLILADESVLAASGYEYYAAIMVSGEGNSLTIYGQTNQTGKLEAYGGNMGAGIGGGAGGSGSDITINGGMVVARGGTSAAGIGGSWGTSGSNITINGGVVEASGGTSGAGIGGGQEAPGTNIIINGGKVAASGGYLATGIGGGYKDSGSNIFVATSLVVKADDTNPPATVITNDGNDLASLLAGKRFATIDLDLAPIKADAIEEIDLAIEGVTDETILAVAAAAKDAITNATSLEEINAVKTFALAKLTVLYQILIARQGIQNAEINSMINEGVNGISNAATMEKITELQFEVMTIIGLFQSGKAEAKAELLGEMGTPCDDCPAVEVTKGTKTVKLYNPEKVEFGKE